MKVIVLSSALFIFSLVFPIVTEEEVFVSTVVSVGGVVYPLPLKLPLPHVVVVVVVHIG